jgi:hypothetical protein
MNVNSGQGLQQTGFLLKRVVVDANTLQADRDKIQEILEDVIDHGGRLIPSANWLYLDARLGRSGCTQPISDALNVESQLKRISSMEEMLAPWIGRQRFPARGEPRSRYAEMLRSADPLQLWETNVEDETVLSQLCEGDLGSILDLNLIYSFSNRTAEEHTCTLLEVGGGYGRLAEAGLNIFGGTVRYVLVDAVPGSLFYAYEYLRRACPTHRIGSYYAGDPFDLTQFDCFIIPAWHFERLNSYHYDVCVNIESFQEMSQSHVDWYIRLFDTVTSAGALIYISNSHDYLFKGKWNYPPTWREDLCIQTPRSWTPDHRTQVFTKHDQDYRIRNAVVEAAFHWSRRRNARLALSRSGIRQVAEQSGAQLRWWLARLRGWGQ